jgi:hypothetical protein
VSHCFANRLILCLCLALVAAPARGADPSSAHGQRLADIINERDSAAFAALIDIAHLGERVVDGLNLSSGDRAGFLKGFRKGGEQLASSSMQQFTHKHAVARLVKSIPRAQGSEQIVRIELRTPEDEADGYDYMQFELDRSGRIRDWISHAQGARTSDLMRRVSATMIADDSLLASLFGMTRIDTDVQDVISRFGKQMRAFDYKGAYATLDRMPSGFKDTVDWASLRVTMASSIDEATYRASLEHLAERHGDLPKLQFLLIDHHHYRGDQKKVLATVEAFERAVVEDGVTNVLKCSSAQQAGDVAAAIGHCERSLALEPEAENTWWLLVALALEQRDTARVLDTLGGYEKQFAMQFDPAKLLQLEGYEWLGAEPAFDAWAESRRDATTAVEAGSADTERNDNLKR